MLSFFENLENYETNKWRIREFLKLFGITKARDKGKILVKFAIDEKRHKFTCAEFISIFNRKGLIRVICNPTNPSFADLRDVIIHYNELVSDEAIDDEIKKADAIEDGKPKVKKLSKEASAKKVAAKKKAAAKKASAKKSSKTKKADKKEDSDKEE